LGDKISAESLEQRFQSFQLRFGRMDVIGLRALCSAESEYGLFVPPAARGLSRGERSALLKDAESRLENIISGFLEIGDIERASAIIADYGLEAAFSPKIKAIEEARARQKKEEERLAEENDRRKREEAVMRQAGERAERERKERERAAAESLRDFDLKMEREIPKANGARLYENPSAPPFDWRGTLHSAWRILRIVVPVFIILAVSKFIYDNWRRLLPIAVIGFFAYGWLRRHGGRFWRL
jgi:hypothetical protein